MSSDETSESEPLIPGGWRLANEELPGEHQEVMVATTHVYAPKKSRRAILKAEHIENGSFYSEGVTWPIHVAPDDARIFYRVTHWAPLPTLPERLGEMPERGEVKSSRDKRIRQMEPHQ